MDNSRLSFLLNKYQTGKCSKEEMRELQNWYEDLNYPINKDLVINEEEMLSELKSRVSVVAPTRRSVYRTIYRYAAILISVSLLSGLYFHLDNKENTTKVQSVARKENKAVFTKLIDKNIIVLSDGSRVVLNGESKLLYPEVFTGDIREVTLIGEAYFDITRDAERPFIINTGNVRTRVLGTAFNIKSIPGEQDVVVTVTRGKVQVENKEAKILAVLTADQQVHYNNQSAKVVETKVDANESISWAEKSRMRFESTAFGDIASRLSQIYGIEIRFSDAELKSCPITASFSGTETLDEILKILCRTRGVFYQIKDKYVVISGQGCNTYR